MKAWEKQEPWRILRAARENASAVFESPSIPARRSSLSTPTIRAPAMTPVLASSSLPCTPEVIARTLKWGILDDVASTNVVHVRRRETSGHILAAAVDKDNKTCKNNDLRSSLGWRILQRQTDPNGDSQVLLVPTNAPRAKRHWYLDKKVSIPDKMLVWRRGGRKMQWVPLPLSLRESTLKRKADREVALLSPAFSPPLRKKGRCETAKSNGCKCSLGGPCKKLRLQSAAAGRLPACDPRLCKFPSKKKVFITHVQHTHTYACMHARTYIHTYIRTHMRTHAHARTHAHTHTHT